MKGKILKPLNYSKTVVIPQGEVVYVRRFQTQQFQFNAPFQIIDGPYSGHLVPREYILLAEEEDRILNNKTFSEKEWNDMKKHYTELLDKEREQNDRLTQTVHNLTQLINKRNQEEKTLASFLTNLNKLLLLQSINSPTISR